jgi:uncharacterized protein YkwD
MQNPTFLAHLGIECPTTRTALAPIHDEAVLAAHKLSRPLTAVALAGTLLTPFAGSADAAASPISAPEYQFFAGVNSDRAANGLPALVLDSVISALAHQRSLGMASSGAFSHYNVAGELIFARMLVDGGVAFAYAGENIAKNDYPLTESLDVANAALMNSPTHRANILNPRYGVIGIGIAGPGQDGDFYFTELFVQTR